MKKILHTVHKMSYFLKREWGPMEGSCFTATEAYKTTTDRKQGKYMIFTFKDLNQQSCVPYWKVYFGGLRSKQKSEWNRWKLDTQRNWVNPHVWLNYYVYTRHCVSYIFKSHTSNGIQVYI